MSQDFKVVLLGEGRVGKTSLVTRYVNGVFNENEASTVQASMYTSVKIPLNDGSDRSVVLNIWDTAGQERFHALAPIYYRNASAALLVYDVTDADTLEKARRWVKELRAVMGEQIRLILCGNKTDCVKEREVREADGERFAAAHGARHFCTSAKTGENVNEAFHAIAAEIVQCKNGTRGSGAAGEAANGETRRKRRGLRIGSDNSSVWRENTETEAEANATGDGAAAVDTQALSSEDYVYDNQRTVGWRRTERIDLSAPRKKNDSETGGKSNCC